MATLGSITNNGNVIGAITPTEPIATIVVLPVIAAIAT